MLIDIKNTTKKIIAILIACPFGSVLADNLIEWPGYINNERCLLGRECGGEGQGPGELAVFPDGNGTFFMGNISGLNKKLERLFNYGNPMKPENYLTRIELEWKVSMYGHSSLDSSGSGIPGTRYQLKGWAARNDVLTLQIRRCLWDGQSTCKLQEVKPEDNIKVTWEDIANNKPLNVTLNRNESVQFINVWMNHNRFRLYSYNPDSDQYVRSIRLPGLKISYKFQAYTQTNKPVNVDDNTWGEDIVLPAKDVKLNDRTCKIVLNDDHDFGEFVVNDQQIGKLGEEKESIIKITCGKYGTNIRNSAGKQEWKEIQGTGKATEGVHHTINNITIMPTYTVNIGNNVPKIGLSSNGTDVAPNLYIEGSLQQGKPCGVSAIEIGKATKPADFNSKFWADKDYKNPNDKSYIFEQPLDTIYWKVCKKEGVVDGGTYKGAVTIAIDFE